MVNALHETEHQIFKEDAGLFARISHQLGLAVAETKQAQVMPTDATEVKPVERRMDTVLDITDVNGTSYILVVESQGKKDIKKISSWAYYAAYLQAKYDKPPVLLVVCHDEATARWAEGPFEFGLPERPTLILRPLVFGPHNLPFITDPMEVAKDIPLAILSTLVHSRSREIGRMLRAVATALKTSDAEIATYLDLLEVGLADTPTANKIWETLMPVDTSLFRGRTAEAVRAEARAAGVVEGRAQGLTKGRKEGEAEGRALDIIRLIQLHGGEVTADQQRRILACTDLELLDRWFDRAVRVTAKRVEDVITEDTED